MNGERSKKKAVLFVSCGIFKEELEYLIRAGSLSMDVIFLDAALHVNFDKLKARLTEALEENRDASAEIRVLYGNCHPEMRKIVRRYGAKKIAAGNCLAAMVGPEEIRKLDSEAKTFFLTAGWVNNWEKIFALGKEDFGLDFGSMFSNYKRIVVFDAGVVPIDESKVEEFSRFTKLPVERRKISLDHFLNLVKSL